MHISLDLWSIFIQINISMPQDYIDILFCRFIFSFCNIVFQNLNEITFKMVYNTSIVHEIMFLVFYPFSRQYGPIFGSANRQNWKKIFFLALILCFHYSLLQKTLRPLGSDDITKSLLHTSQPYITTVFKACVCYFSSNVYFSPNDSLSKTMKNVFHFT